MSNPTFHAKFGPASKKIRFTESGAVHKPDLSLIISSIGWKRIEKKYGNPAIKAPYLEFRLICLVFIKKFIIDRKCYYLNSSVIGNITVPNPPK